MLDYGIMLQLISDAQENGRAIAPAGNPENGRRRLQLQLLVEIKLMCWISEDSARLSAHGYKLFNDANGGDGERVLRYYFEEYASSCSVANAMNAVAQLNNPQD